MDKISASRFFCLLEDLRRLEEQLETRASGRSISGDFFPGKRGLWSAYAFTFGNQLREERLLRLESAGRMFLFSGRRDYDHRLECGTFV